MGRKPTNHLEIGRIIGMEAALKLCAEYGGEDIYIPKLENVMDNSSAQIVREYNGYNVRELSRRYNLTERRIYQIVQGVGIKQIDGQITFDDMAKRSQ